MNPRRGRGFSICVQSSILLACASCRTGTICQPRKFYYLLPVNGFRISSSSVVLLLCLPPSSFHFSTRFPHNILGAQIPGFAQFRVLLADYQTALPFESAHETGHIHFLRYFHQQMHWSRHTSASTFLIPNFTAFANFLLSLVFFHHRVSFCDFFGQIRCGSCHSSLYTPRSRLWDKLFTSFIATPPFAFYSARTFILKQRKFLSASSPLGFF